MGHPSASFSATLRVRLTDRPGAFADLARAIADALGPLGAIDLVRVGRGEKVRDVTVLAEDEAHVRAIVGAVRALPGIEVEHVSDRTFLLHLGGKIEVVPKTPLRTRDDLSMAYTPGVARVCEAIADDPDAAWNLTIKRNTIAVVTIESGIAVRVNIGPEAALPVMEGKAMLFKEFGGVDAFPLCLSTKDPDEIVATVEAVAPTFGGINLEDISAPRCFEIEDRLKKSLDIPVFHDDQHGTAVVVLAALINALKVADKRMEDVRIVINGSGAAGVAVAKLLLKYGAGDIILCDTFGALHTGRKERMNRSKNEIAAITNKDRLAGRLEQVITGTDVFIGLSAPGSLTQAMIGEMNSDPIIFALANPTPEIEPRLAKEAGALVVATGRSDYANQVNNSLAFPGIFRGALDAKARNINDEMKIAAAEAIAALVGSQLRPDFIIPDSISLQVPPKVAAAVARAAAATGEARVPVDPDAIEARTFDMLYEGITD